MVLTRKRALEEAALLVNRHKECKVEDEEDHLSGLPNDCVMDIFRRLDHQDLDEISTLDNRLCRLADASRAKAIKLEANRLFVGQVDRHGFPAAIRINDQKFVLEMAESGLFKCSSAKGNRPRLLCISVKTQEPEATEAVLDRAATLLSRFRFRKLEFFGVCIDDNFLAFLEHIGANHSATPFHLIFSHCRFDVNLSPSSFTTKLLSAKPAKINVHRTEDNNVVDEQFMREYAMTVTHPHLQIREFDPQDIRPQEEFAEALSKFATMDNKRLVVNTDWLMPALLKRLQRGTPGEWIFRLTRNIEENDVEAVLSEDVSCNAYVDENLAIRNISIIGTQHFVQLKSFLDHFGTAHKLEARFL